MSLLDFIEDDGPGWTRTGDLYEVTRKPRGLDLSSIETIPFAPMEAIPQGGVYSPNYVPKTAGTITSGTYFERGDLLVAKITPSFENGKQALTFNLPAPFGYATTEVIPLRPRKSGQDRRLLFFYLLHPDIRHYVAERMEGSTGRKRVPENVLLDLPFPEIEPNAQSAIADALELIQRTSMEELRCEEKAQNLKRAAMRALFTKGLRGEAQKETEIGPVPESWDTRPLEQVATIYSSSRLNYSELLAREGDYDGDDAVPVLGIKVIDMARCEAEAPLSAAELCRIISKAEAEHRCIRPRAIVFPKNGAAVATNKKRQVTDWCVLDPNVMALHAKDGVEQAYLYQWFQNFDLRTIVKPGPVPNFGKGDIAGVLVPVPPTLEEQRDIVAILDAIDRKIDLHRRKRAVLDELFKALLHKLMTGEIRVADLDLSARDAKPAAEVAA